MYVLVAGFRLRKDAAVVIISVRHGVRREYLKGNITRYIVRRVVRRAVVGNDGDGRRTRGMRPNRSVARDRGNAFVA